MLRRLEKLWEERHGRKHGEWLDKAIVRMEAKNEKEGRGWRRLKDAVPEGSLSGLRIVGLSEKSSLVSSAEPASACVH